MHNHLFFASSNDRGSPQCIGLSPCLISTTNTELIKTRVTSEERCLRQYIVASMEVVFAGLSGFLGREQCVEESTPNSEILNLHCEALLSGDRN